MTEEMRVMLGSNTYPLVWSERRDSGGMFESTVGVARDGDRFVAFVKDGWGGGVKTSRTTEEDARREIERLWERMYG